MREVEINPPAMVREAESVSEMVSKCRSMYSEVVRSDKRSLDSFVALGRILPRIKAACEGVQGEYGRHLAAIGVSRQRASEAIRIASADLSGCESIRDALEKLGEVYATGNCPTPDNSPEPISQAEAGYCHNTDLQAADDDCEPASSQANSKPKACLPVSSKQEAAYCPQCQHCNPPASKPVNSNGLRKQTGSKTPTLQTPGSPVFVACRDCRVRGLAACVCRKR